MIEEKCIKCGKQIPVGSSICYINNNLFCIDCGIPISIHRTKFKKDVKKIEEETIEDLKK